MTTTARRLRTFAADYARDVWPSLAYRAPSANEITTMEIRADGYSNAHVEGEHAASGCTFSATECGLRAAAAEYVECTDFSEPVATPRTGSHAGHDHPATKAARAACRRTLTAERIVGDQLEGKN